MLYSIAEVAIYLNQATLRIRRDGGSLNFLTGTSTTISYNSSGRSEETQCMRIGTSSLWIANNDDADSTTQKNFLDKLGILDFRDLIDHVDNYGTRILPTHAGSINVGGGTSIQLKLLHNLISRHGDVPLAQPYTISDSPVSNRTYKLSSSLSPPADSSILFVEGTYEGSGGAKLHAEQKLLAAFGRYLTATGYRGPVTVAGVKMPCLTCDQVLASIAEFLAEHYPAVKLTYRNAYVDELRVDVGLNAYSASGIRSLNLGTYFTRPG